MGQLAASRTGIAVKQGDVFYTSLEPTVGHEQRGHRPVLVLTPERYNLLTKMPIVAAITTSGAFAVRNDLSVSLDGAGMSTSGIVRCDQIRSIDLEARGARYVEAAPRYIVDEAISLVTAILG